MGPQADASPAATGSVPTMRHGLSLGKAVGRGNSYPPWGARPAQPWLRTVGHGRIRVRMSAVTRAAEPLPLCIFGRRRKEDTSYRSGQAQGAVSLSFLPTCSSLGSFTLFHSARLPWLIPFFSAIFQRVSPFSTTYIQSPLPSVAPAPDAPTALIPGAGIASASVVAGGTVATTVGASTGATTAGSEAANSGSSFVHAPNKATQAIAVSNFFISFPLKMFERCTAQESNTPPADSRCDSAGNATPLPVGSRTENQKVNYAKFVNFPSSSTNFKHLLPSRAATDALDKRNRNKVLRHLPGRRLVAIAGHLQVTCLRI